MARWGRCRGCDTMKWVPDNNICINCANPQRKGKSCIDCGQVLGSKRAIRCPGCYDNFRMGKLSAKRARSIAINPEGEFFRSIDRDNQRDSMWAPAHMPPRCAACRGTGWRNAGACGECRAHPGAVMSAEEWARVRP